MAYFCKHFLFCYIFLSIVVKHYNNFLVNIREFKYFHIPI